MGGINKKAIEEEFNNKIGRLSKSRAYLDYCEEVYGYRTYLFNMLDKAQLDFVLNAIPISDNDVVLDLGCGSGSILSLLVTKYGCRGVGIDRLDETLLYEVGKNFQYINGDIDAFVSFGVKPTITLSVDSLYFSEDPDGLIRQLNGVKNNRLYLFYSQYLFDEASADRRTLNSDQTKIAEILRRNAIRFSAVDYSENERALYRNSIRVLQKLEPAFEKEGNADLYQNKLSEESDGHGSLREGPCPQISLYRRRSTLISFPVSILHIYFCAFHNVPPE